MQNVLGENERRPKVIRQQQPQQRQQQAIIEGKAVLSTSDGTTH